MSLFLFLLLIIWGFCWRITQTWTPRNISFYATRRSFCESDYVSASTAAPHFNLLIFLHQCFHLKVKDMIEKCHANLIFQKTKESTHKQIICIHNYLVIICCIVCTSLYYIVIIVFFSPTVNAVRHLLKKTIISCLRWRRQLPRCSHGNQFGGNNFAFIKFKVEFFCHWGKVGFQ